MILMSIALLNGVGYVNGVFIHYQIGDDGVGYPKVVYLRLDIIYRASHII